MSSHNSVSDVDINRPFFIPHVLEQMCCSLKRFSFLRVSLFYPPVVRWKIGITKSADRSLASKDRPQQRINGSSGRTFVNTLTAFLQNFPWKKQNKTNQKRVGNTTPVCVHEQNPLTTQCLCARDTLTRAHTNSLAFSQSHKPTQTFWTNCSIKEFRSKMKQKSTEWTPVTLVFAQEGLFSFHSNKTVI